LELGLVFTRLGKLQIWIRLNR